MPTLKQIKKNLEATSTIKTITSIYQEIAHLRMNQIRQRVLSNRDFIEELSRVYGRIKKAYINSLKKRGKLKKKELKKISFIKRNRRKIAVFLSSNQFFYGTLILDIWRNLLNFLANSRTDLAVVGKTGKYLAEKSGFRGKIFYFELDDDDPKREQMKKIMDFIKNYEEITVFHGRFSTAISQKPVQDNISGGIILESEKESDKVKNYLFEPSPEDILEFFETELISAFFNQAVLEHRLSRYAARMVSMYQATENAKKIKRKLKIKQKKLERQLLNKKQIELFAGFQLWQ